MSDVDDIALIRDFLSKLPASASASAATPLPDDELYTPPTHANALDPNRTLVVGNRGVGKSVWSGVLANDGSRDAIAGAYPSLSLKSLRVRLGFHEDAGKTDGDVAPSPKLLASMLKRGFDAEDIWAAVLLRAVAPHIGRSLPETLRETVCWMADSVEEAEGALRAADAHFARNRLIFVLVFDALDRLGRSWQEIRPLAEGILRLAHSMAGYRAMRAKVFIRTDQMKDQELFRFPDASKMKSAAVDLAWHSTELYGLLFRRLYNAPETRKAFSRMVCESIGKRADPANIDEEKDQAEVFKRLAGEFMGSNHRRGRTYRWLIGHLADAFGETTPRSFLIALKRAAAFRNKPKQTVIDYLGLREGVQAASSVRVDQLKEDYPWIESVLADLEGLEVPCSPKMFINRWKERKTVAGIPEIFVDPNKIVPVQPIELEQSVLEKEVALIEALKTIGVVEERSDDRINMPDIFRVAAKMKRRGGVRPPAAGRKR